MFSSKSKSFIPNIIDNDIKPTSAEEKKNGKKFPVRFDHLLEQEFLKSDCSKR